MARERAKMNSTTNAGCRHGPCQRCQVVRQLPQVIRVQAEGREGGGIGHLRRQEADAVVGHVEAAQARQRAHGHGHLLEVVV